MLFQLAFGQAGGEVGTVNRDVELLQNERQGAQMVLVAVRENDSGNVIAIFFEDIEIGDADIDAVDALFGESHAGIDDDHLVTASHKRAIHPKLADTAERYDLEHTHFCYSSRCEDGRAPCLPVPQDRKSVV